MSQDPSEAPPPPGVMRLYRYDELLPGANQKPIPEWLSSSPEYQAGQRATGRWFGERLDVAWYADHIEKDGRVPVLKSIDIPIHEAEQCRVSNLPQDHPARRYTQRPESEFFVAVEAARRARVVEDAPETLAMRRMVGIIEKLNSGEYVSRKDRWWAVEHAKNPERFKRTLEDMGYQTIAPLRRAFHEGRR